MVKPTYTIFKGFSLRLFDFSPQNGCLSSADLNVFYFTSVFSSFSQVFSLVLGSFKVVGPEAFVSLHSSSWDARFSTIHCALLITLPILSGCCEKSSLSWCRFISNLISEASPFSLFKVPGILMYESNIICCWVRVILAITGLCPDPGSSSMMRFVFVLMSLDTCRRSGVVWAALKWRYVDGSVSLYISSKIEVLSNLPSLSLLHWCPYSST